MTSSISNSQSHPENYQPHIDGLRAIAVLSVILFHANNKWISGGFVGVDIFFVISGYLISGLIFTQQLNGRFSLSDFYIKRMRRIFPAMFVVITIVFAIAWCVMLPDEMRHFSKSMFTSLLMYSNKQFQFEAGYFDSESHLKPLLHMWSLSIEGQFYILFPLIFIGLLKYVKQVTIPVAFLLFVSFFYADQVSSLDSEKSFFYFSTRAWELLAGCLVMLLFHQSNTSQQRVAELLSIIGLCLIFYSIFFFNSTMLHPGRITLIPVIGAALLIVFSTEHTLVGKLLSSRIMVNIGLISYSLYLWHQPLISFAKAQYEVLSYFAWALIFSLMGLLSIFTWKFIERPFRTKQFISTPNFLITSSIAFVLLSGFGLWGYHSNGFIKERFTKEKFELINALDSDIYKNFLFKHLYDNEISKKKYINNAKPKILVVGDSYAADFMNMMISNRQLTDYQVRTLYIPARCQFYMGDNDYLMFLDKKDEALCENAQEKLSFLKRNLGAFDHIIFVFNWKPWAVDHIKKSIETLNDKVNKRLIFIGTKQFVVNKREILSHDIETLRTLTSPRVESTIKLNKSLAKLVEPHIFIDQDEIFCGGNNQCPLFTENVMPISVDGSHLTRDGASYLGKILFATIELSKLGNKN